MERALPGSRQLSRRRIGRTATTARLALLYLAALALAESLTALVEPRLGLLLHGLILGALLHGAHLARGPWGRFLLGLALAPLIRLVSLSVPLPQIPIVYWYLLVGVPLFVAVYLAAHLAHLNRGMLGLTGRSILAQIPIALAGIGLGYIEWIILRPDPLVRELRWEQALLPVLILLVFTGLLEELIFRGVMQYTAQISLGRFGLLYVAVVFTILHLGYRSALDVLFVFGVALFFGWAVQRTGSLLGVSLAHGLTNISLYLVFPFLLAHPAGLPATPVNAPADILAPVEVITPFFSIPLEQPTATSTPSSTPPAPIDDHDRTPVPPTGTAIPTATPTVTIPVPTETAIPPEEPQPPAAELCGPPQGWMVYTVQRGDTLSALARSYGVSVAALRKANCMRSADLLYAGSALWVPFYRPTPTPWSPGATLPPAATPQPRATAQPTSAPATTAPPPTEAFPTSAPTLENSQPPPPTETLPTSTPTLENTQPPPPTETLPTSAPTLENTQPPPPTESSPVEIPTLIPPTEPPVEAPTPAPTESQDPVESPVTP